MENINILHIQKILNAALKEENKIKKDFLIHSVVRVLTKEIAKEPEHV